MTVDFIINVGDSFYQNHDNEEMWEKSWVDVYDTLTNISWLSVIGNHDINPTCTGEKGETCRMLTPYIPISQARATWHQPDYNWYLKKVKNGFTLHIYGLYTNACDMSDGGKPVKSALDLLADAVDMLKKHSGAATDDTIVIHHYPLSMLDNSTANPPFPAGTPPTDYGKQLLKLFGTIPRLVVLRWAPFIITPSITAEIFPRIGPFFPVEAGGTALNLRIRAT